MTESPAPRQVLAAWTSAIEEGLADIAAGRTFDFEEVMAEFEREDDAERSTKAACVEQERSRVKA